MSQISTILVPTDFSPASLLATDYAIDMARRYGASIELLHVMEDVFMSVAPEGFVDVPGLRARVKADAEEQLTMAGRRCAAADVPVTATLRSGHPVVVIVEHANAAAPDLIVMGTHGRSGLAHMFLGSVAERVVRTAPCPVLTVRETSRIAESVAADAALRGEPVALQPV